MSLGRTEIRQRYTWQQPGKMCLLNVLTHSCIIIHYIVEEKTFFRYCLQAFRTADVLKCHIKDCFKIGAK